MRNVPISCVPVTFADTDTGATSGLLSACPAHSFGRAATSIALNIAEGEHSDRGTARSRFQSAAGSASETRSAIRLATAWRYLQPNQVASSLDGLDRVLAMLWRLTH